MIKVVECKTCGKDFECEPKAHGRPRTVCYPCQRIRKAYDLSTTKQCIQCGGPFHPQYGNASLYCGRTCYLEATTKYAEIPCAECGTPFMPSVMTQRYCSRRCYFGEHETRACETCGVEVSRAVGGFRYEGVFCGLPCYWQARHDRIKTIGPEPMPVPGAAWLRLTNGYFTLVDEDVLGALKDQNWAARPSSGLIYVIRSVGSDETPEALHRVLMGVVDPSVEVDHINCDTLDNRRSNLRATDDTGNAMNQRKTRRRSRSRFKGVGWFAKISKWGAQITHNGSKRYLGVFVNEVDAARAYDAEARLHHGAFARLNFPNPGEQSALRL